MKESYYNFLYARETGAILFNARTGAMAELDQEHLQELRLLSGQEIEKQDPEFAKALLDNEFMVDDMVSELDMIRHDLYQSRFNMRSLSLTIAPTLDCNFACEYCYEKSSKENLYMMDETAEAVMSFVRGKMFAGRKLNVEWYGGEPLLALDIIRKLSRGFQDICREFHSEYKSGIVTNGYYLNSNVVEALKQCGVMEIQITLDGKAEYHDRRRPLADGSGTYRTIVNNLIALGKTNEPIPVALRVNIDRKNQEALADVNRMVRGNGLSDFVTVYPGRTSSVNGCYQSVNCYSDREFAQAEYEYYKNIGVDEIGKYPRPVHGCCADNPDGMVINADGAIYKCWSDIGIPERKTGDVYQGLKYGRLYYEYVLFDATEDEVCRKCKILPLCMGGCPYQRSLGKRDCSPYRYVLDKYMEYLPERIISIRE